MNKRLLALATLAAVVASSVWAQAPPPVVYPFQGGFPHRRLRSRCAMTLISSAPSSPTASGMWIPIQSGQVFRREAGRDSEMMSATIPI